MSALPKRSDELSRRFGRLSLLSLFLFSVFLVLLTFYHSRQMEEVEQENDRQLQERIALLFNLADNSFRSDPPSFTYLKSQSEIRRFSFADENGKSLGDSLEKIKPGETYPNFGLTSKERALVLSGKSIRIHVFREDSGKVIQAFFAPVHTARGTIIGRILVEDSSDGKSTPLGVVLWIYGVVAFGVIAYSVIRISPKGWSGKVSGGNTGLMIDAFHGLIAKLKEKEEELQRLKHSAEERAHEVENYNENILQSVTSGVITLDREMKITTINAAAESILCLKCDEALAKSGEGIFGEKSAVMLLLRKAASDGTIVSRQELELERASGERIWVGISISLLRDRRGSIIGTTLVFTDLTEIKKLQEQVEVKKRLTVLGEMSAWIAHEFRNYMGTILGLARLLSKGSSEGQQQAMVQSIIEELSAMDRLITELLSYGKKTELHLEAISLREFIGEVVQSFEAAGKCDRVGIRIDVPQGIPSVSIDPVLMRQALSNLIQNALESSGEASGGEIQITAWQRPSEVVLEVSDNGEGIPREHLEKIFLPFFTTKEKGTGLGLALVHKIVMSHNGRIEARNREEGGASFALTLPICVTRDAWKPYSSSKIGKV